jgi:hypothetical protein
MHDADAGLLAIQLLFTAADWRQTRYISAHPAQYYDHNPLLGPHPSAEHVNRHFIVYESVVLTSSLLSPEYRTEILGISASVEVGFVAHNYSIGIRANF